MEHGTSVTGSGDSSDQRMTTGEDELTLTTRQGHPVKFNQNIRTVGNRGPGTLENYHFIEKISHFGRERIPERVVHAPGAGAHGYFEAYGKVGDEPVSKYTRAKVFEGAGKQTPVFIRFSTVIHGGHSPETLRDPRGFAVKFYTEDGNWDLKNKVYNNDIGIEATSEHKGKKGIWIWKEEEFKSFSEYQKSTGNDLESKYMIPHDYMSSLFSPSCLQKI